MAEKLNKEHVAKLLAAWADYQKQLQTVTRQHQVYAQLKHDLARDLATEKDRLEDLQKKRKELKTRATIDNLIETLQQDLSVVVEIQKSESLITALALRQTQMANSWAELSTVLFEKVNTTDLKRARLPLIPLFNHALNHLQAGDKLWWLEQKEKLIHVRTETAHSVVCDGLGVTVTYKKAGELTSMTSRPLLELFDVQDGGAFGFSLWPQLPSTVMDLATQGEILKTMRTTFTFVFVDN